MSLRHLKLLWCECHRFESRILRNISGIKLSALLHHFQPTVLTCHLRLALENGWKWERVIVELKCRVRIQLLVHQGIHWINGHVVTNTGTAGAKWNGQDTSLRPASLLAAVSGRVRNCNRRLEHLVQVAQSVGRLEHFEDHERRRHLAEVFRDCASVVGDARLVRRHLLN